MTRWNVELKYQTSVDADSEDEAYRKAKEQLEREESLKFVFLSHCKKVKK